MSLVRWNDEGKSPKYVTALGLWAIASGLFYFFGGLRLAGMMWAPRGDEGTAWWPRMGPASTFTLLASLLITCLFAAFQKRLTNSEAVGRAILLVVVAGCVAAIGFDSLARVEVSRDGFNVTDAIGQTRRYGPNDIERFEVSCLFGSRGSAEPSLVIFTRDGRETDIGDISAVAWNGPPKPDWLAAAETVSMIARHRGVWALEMHPSGRSNVYIPCVSRFAERFPAHDRDRVKALFRSPEA